MGKLKAIRAIGVGAAMVCLISVVYGLNSGVIIPGLTLLSMAVMLGAMVWMLYLKIQAGMRGPSDATTIILCGLGMIICAAMGLRQLFGL